MSRSIISALLLLSLFSLGSCQEENHDDNFGYVHFYFQHLVDETPVQFDQMQYVNGSGNVYEITEIQWFISDITLVRDDGTEILPEPDRIAYYVDTNLSYTMKWSVADLIPAGDYKTIRITFGIKGAKNIPYAFPNPPESNMIWPYNLGGDYGGYHYMKLNGFWLDTSAARTPFNFHIGVGPIYDETDNAVEFVQNWFETKIPESAFTLLAGETKIIFLEMNVDRWFDNPHQYDHNQFGGKIMKNQNAMRIIRENGFDVFSVQFDSIQYFPAKNP